jgi:hypothetical protein
LSAEIASFTRIRGLKTGLAAALAPRPSIPDVLLRTIMCDIARYPLKPGQPPPADAFGP